jgi:HSP20 family protein
MTLVKHQTAHPFRNVWNDFFFSPVWDNNVATAVQPAVNILEIENGFKLEVVAPGFDKEDFALKIEKNILTISAKKEVKQEENSAKPLYRRKEYTFTSFERSFKLPESIDNEQVNASLNNGILHVELVKKPELVPAVKTITVA